MFVCVRVYTRVCMLGCECEYVGEELQSAEERTVNTEEGCVWRRCTCLYLCNGVWMWMCGCGRCVDVDVWMCGCGCVDVWTWMCGCVDVDVWVCGCVGV